MESMMTRRRGGPGGFWMKCSMRRSRSSRSSHVAMSRSTYILSKASPVPQYLHEVGHITSLHDHLVLNARVLQKLPVTPLMQSPA